MVHIVTSNLPYSMNRGNVGPKLLEFQDMNTLLQALAPSGTRNEVRLKHAPSASHTAYQLMKISLLSSPHALVLNNECLNFAIVRYDHY